MELANLRLRRTEMSTEAHGKIVSVSPLTVQFNATAVSSAVPGIQPLVGYTPAAGDRVLMKYRHGIWWIDGKVA